MRLIRFHPQVRTRIDVDAPITFPPRADERAVCLILRMRYTERVRRIKVQYLKLRRASFARRHPFVVLE